MAKKIKAIIEVKTIITPLFWLGRIFRSEWLFRHGIIIRTRGYLKGKKQYTKFAFFPQGVVRFKKPIINRDKNGRFTK